MPNPATNLDQEHDHNQGPVLVILKPQDMRHNHGHYIHDDDTWGRKRTRSPVALSHLRLDHGTSPPQSKSPPV